MRTNSLRLSPSWRKWTYSVLAVLFASGIAWWLLQAFGQTESEFGPSINPLTPWMLRLHGAAAMLTLILLGALWPVHIRRSWQARKNRQSGTLMIALATLLVITGWLLYYAGLETLRTTASFAHRWLGLLLPGFLLGHIWRGRRERRRTCPPQ